MSRNKAPPETAPSPALPALREKRVEMAERLVSGAIIKVLDHDSLPNTLNLQVTSIKFISRELPNKTLERDVCINFKKQKPGGDSLSTNYIYAASTDRNI